MYTDLVWKKSWKYVLEIGNMVYSWLQLSLITDYIRNGQQKSNNNKKKKILGFDLKFRFSDFYLPEEILCKKKLKIFLN